MEATLVFSVAECEVLRVLLGAFEATHGFPCSCVLAGRQILAKSGTKGTGKDRVGVGDSGDVTGVKMSKEVVALTEG